MQYCQSCLQSYTAEEISANKTNTMEKINVFQCTQCFYISDPITIYNADDNCPICLDQSDAKCVYNVCHHWNCKNCQRMINPSTCSICKFKSGITNIKKHTYNYFDAVDPTIKADFKNLYAQINDTVGKPRIKNYKNILYDACAEYHKFLQLLHINDNNNNPNKLSPSYYIDRIWHEHILNLPSYIRVCNTICGYILYHYPENSYAVNILSYTARFNRTLNMYTNTFGGVNSTIIWAPTRSYTDSEDISEVIDPNKIVVYVKTLSDKPKKTIIIDQNATILELKELIHEKTSIPVLQMRTIYGGRALSEEKTLQDYGMKSYETVHVLLARRAC